MKPIGIYLHFPFCKQKCSYCDFNSYSGMENLIPDYIEAMLTEIKGSSPAQTARSIFFGGGTPSYLSPGLLAKVLQAVREHFEILPEAEITLEANPGTVTFAALERFLEAGFNRLSIGLQVSQDHLLKEIGRIHQWQDFVHTFQQAREIGFSNISVDLIFGLPGQTVLDWRETLCRVTGLDPEHISAYGLQLEPDTPLSHKVENGLIQLPSEEETLAMFELSMAFLPERGYLQYEISNYAKSGYASKHNLGYWLGEDYIGFGAGATSTVAGERWTNLASPAEYIRNLSLSKTIVVDREKLDQQTMAEEKLMLGLRLRSGINLNEYRIACGIDLRETLGEVIDWYLENGLLEMRNGCLRLTNQGLPVSNEIIVGLLRYLS